MLGAVSDMGAALLLFMAGGGTVAVEIKVDSEKAMRQLMRAGKQAAKQMDWATKDMKRAAPGIVASHTVSRYNIAKGKVNANSKTFKGGCRMTGGIADLSIVYTGEMMTPVHFGMSPKAHNPGRGYTVKAKILKGSPARLGEWRKPWSQGGAYGAKAKPMLMPDKVPPISRDGGKTKRKKPGKGPGTMAHSGGTYEAVKVISVPQMVGNEHIIDGTLNELQERRQSILIKRLGNVL